MVESVSAFFEMGGYGAYVWSAFGFTGAVLLGLLVQSVVKARRREREFLRLREVARSGGERPARERRTAVRERPLAPAGDVRES